jgi:hypothetical protein
VCGLLPFELCSSFQLAWHQVPSQGTLPLRVFPITINATHRNPTPTQNVSGLDCCK